MSDDENFKCNIVQPKIENSPESRTYFSEIACLHVRDARRQSDGYLQALTHEYLIEQSGVDEVETALLQQAPTLPREMHELCAPRCTADVHVPACPPSANGPRVP